MEKLLFADNQINDKLISSVHFKEEQSLWDYYNLCGLSPALTFESSKCFDYKKITYSLEDMFLCTTKSLSGWGFEKTVSTDVYFISFTYCGASAWEMNKIGHVCASQQLSIIDSSRLVQGQFAAGTKTDTVMINASSMHRELAALQGFHANDRIEFLPLLPKASKTWSLLHAIIQTVKLALDNEGAVASPITISYLKQALLLAVLETAPHTCNSVIRDLPTAKLPRYVSRAIDYIHAHASEPITLVEISENACTSVRNLQLGFNKYKRTTPMGYLRMVRLSKARIDLLSEEIIESWQNIGMRWGFYDAGLFVKYYQKVYQETPFQTCFTSKGKI
jgi:AraC-like DNA-binding protein